MKQKINLIILILLPLSLQSQNLIMNGGFENLEKDTLSDWQNIAGTPDYFNLNNIKKDYVWETNKRFFKGVKSKGFIGYAFGKTWTEVISSQLKNPLIKDSIYTIQIHFLTGHSCKSGLDNITIGLTKEELEKSYQPKYYQINCFKISNGPNKIKGEAWNILKGNYKATGGEKNISLGNFNNENQAYILRSDELLIKGQLDSSCHYLIIDEIILTKATNDSFTKKPLNEPSITIEDIAFDIGEWEIKNEYYNELITKIQTIKKRKDNFTIIGYTDNIGSEAENQILSLKRATAVKDILINQGVNPGRIKVIGKGEQSPKYSNETELGRSKNRRIEIQFNKENAVE